MTVTAPHGHALPDNLPVLTEVVETELPVSAPFAGADSFTRQHFGTPLDLPPELSPVRPPVLDVKPGDALFETLPAIDLELGAEAGHPAEKDEALFSELAPADIWLDHSTPPASVDSLLEDFDFAFDAPDSALPLSASAPSASWQSDVPDLDLASLMPDAVPEAMQPLPGADAHPDFNLPSRLSAFETEAGETETGHDLPLQSGMEAAVPVLEDMFEPAPALTPALMEEPAPAVMPVLMEEPEPVLTPVPMEEPEPVLTPVPMEEPEPAVTPVLMEEPAPALTPVPMEEPEPVLTPVPMEEPEPVLTPVPMEEPESVLTPVLMEEPAPAVTPALMEEPAPVLTPVLMEEPEPALTPVLMEEPEPVLTPAQMAEPSPVICAPVESQVKKHSMAVVDEAALLDAVYQRIVPRMKVELTLWLQDAIEVQSKHMLAGVMQQMKEDYDMLFGETLRESVRQAIADIGRNEQYKDDHHG
ncbi:hypothetical protein [Craterilacuibacter sp. RT1T]|uniref:hypothetical protein n=1 Tax=Craterilacuibacter sp. RT1T TaxID=2942211 RepID=UPI0020BFC18B|nr:hypothetical protein [Craterilacuibacter sp. RT1T]MCL6262864.1 hypothetical protein [Craterilacuibacter sp. RT1T]